MHTVRNPPVAAPFKQEVFILEWTEKGVTCWHIKGPLVTDDIDDLKFIIKYTHVVMILFPVWAGIKKNGANISANEGPFFNSQPIRKQ